MDDIPCHLCGARERFRQLWSVPDRLLGLDIRFVLGACRNCGFVYLNPRPNPQELARHYPAAYYNPPPHQPPFCFRWRLSQITAHKTTGRVLDVGCGNGGFLTFLRQQGWDVHGLDASPSAIHIASQQLGERVSLTTLVDAAYPANHFDVICLFEVLEHLPDPALHLQEIHRILKPGGLVCLSVPNFASWERVLFSRWWSGLDIPRHLNQFTPITLTRFLQAAGFSMLTLKSTSAHHIQVRISRITYLQESLRYLLRDVRLYPPVKTQLTQPPDICPEPVRSTWKKRMLQCAEGAIFYPLWLLNTITDRDNTIWAIGTKASS